MLMKSDVIIITIQAISVRIFNLNKFYSIAILVFTFFNASRPVTAQQLRNTYRFYNSLSTTEADCFSDLTPTKGLNIQCQSSTAPAAGSFILDTLVPSNISRTVYHNNLNWGLKYLNTSGVISSTYTVQMYLRVTNFNKFYTRIIDFSDGVQDNGLYFTNYYTPPPITDRCLNFYPNGNFGTCPYFNNNIYYLLTITRNDLTKFLDIYVNNRLFTSYYDVANFYVGIPGKPIHIFRDDPVGTECEDGEANFAYLSFANYFSTLADVSLLYQNINTVVNSAEFSISAYPHCIGDNITVNYTGDIPVNANQYVFNWNWNGANIISGSGRGPYIINWATPGIKTISLSISGGPCTTPITNSKQILIGQDIHTTIDTSICLNDSYEGYSSPGTYINTFITILGCDSTRTLHLSNKICGIYFPSAFTPNKDGKNETFKILGDNSFSWFSLKIFNRYGQIVFETTKPEKGWDGTYKGKDSDNGVYVWLCYLEKPNTNRKQFIRGTVILLR